MFTPRNRGGLRRLEGKGLYLIRKKGDRQRAGLGLLCGAGLTVPQGRAVMTPVCSREGGTIERALSHPRVPRTSTDCGCIGVMCRIMIYSWGTAMGNSNQPFPLIRIVTVLKDRSLQG